MNGGRLRRPRHLVQHWQSTQVQGLHLQVLRFGLFEAATGAGVALTLVLVVIDGLLCCQSANHALAYGLWYGVKHEKWRHDCAAGQGG